MSWRFRRGRPVGSSHRRRQACKCSKLPICVLRISHRPVRRLLRSNPLDWDDSETNLSHLTSTKPGAEKSGGDTLWEDNWDDDDIEDEYSVQLRLVFLLHPRLYAFPKTTFPSQGGTRKGKIWLGRNAELTPKSQPRCTSTLCLDNSILPGQCVNTLDIRSEVRLWQRLSVSCPSGKPRRRSDLKRCHTIANRHCSSRSWGVGT